MTDNPLSRLTREQAAVLTLTTGVVCGIVDDAIDLASIITGRQVLLHELGTGAAFDEIRTAALPMLAVIAPDPDAPKPTWPIVDLTGEPG